MKTASSVTGYRMPPAIRMTEPIVATAAAVTGNLRTPIIVRYTTAVTVKLSAGCDPHALLASAIIPTTTNRTTEVTADHSSGWRSNAASLTSSLPQLRVSMLGL